MSDQKRQGERKRRREDRYHSPSFSSGYKILERARHQLEQAAVDEETGLHEPAVVDPPPLTPSALSVDVDQRIEAIEKGLGRGGVVGGEWHVVVVHAGVGVVFVRSLVQ